MSNLALLARPDGHGGFIFTPATGEDSEAIVRMHVRAGDEIRAVFKRARNPAHHRLVFALLAFVFANQERFDNQEALRAYLTLRTSFCHTYQDKGTGSIFRIPRSWAWDSMSEDEFSAMHDELVEVVLKDFMPGITGDQLADATAQHAYINGVESFA